MTDLETVQTWLRGAKSVAVLTGAGISAESGVPVFRGPGGLWRKHKPETLATAEAFAHDPKLVWEWYDWRRSRVAEAEPNPGHYALAQLGEAVGKFTLITQNVDGLHDRAGSRNILKLHGDLWTLRCVGCGNEQENHDVPVKELPPRCSCRAMLRPGVVWFGEALPVKVLEQAAEVSARAEVFMVIGTSAVVQPAASLPLLARQQGGKVVEINLEPTPLSPHMDVTLLGPSGAILPQLLGTGVVQ
jgi:NAD-dependent deacetylase